MNNFKDGFAEHLRLLLTNDATITADYAMRQRRLSHHLRPCHLHACKDLHDGERHAAVADQIARGDARRKRRHHLSSRRHFRIRRHATSSPFPISRIPIRRLSAGPASLCRTSAIPASMVLASRRPISSNLAPNYDLTFLPIFTTEQGVLAKADWRHRLANGSYTIDAAGIYQLDTNQDAARRYALARGCADAKAISPSIAIGTGAGTARSSATGLPGHIQARWPRRGDQPSSISPASTTVTISRLRRSTSIRWTPEEHEDFYPYAVPYIQHSYTLDQPVLGGEFGLDWNVYSLHRTDPVLRFRS